MALGAVVTQLANWVELSWYSGPAMWWLWKLNPTRQKSRQFVVSREIMSMFRTSRLTENWRFLSSWVELSWVFRVITSPNQTQLNSTQLASWVTIAPDSLWSLNWFELTWVGQCDHGLISNSLCSTIQHALIVHDSRCCCFFLIHLGLLPRHFLVWHFPDFSGLPGMF